MITIVEDNQINQLMKLMQKLWPEDSIEELKEEFYTSNEESFLYHTSEDGTIGFIQLSLRHDYVEGCDTSPVAYIEGIYVEEQYRRQGIALELLEFAENWGKKRNCTELASDCELENALSIKFHKGTDFEEVNRLVCFKKKL